MLTMPLLILCWTIALASFITMIVMLKKRRWLWASVSYFLTGFFLISVPFKIGLHAMNFFGMCFLAAIWPVWMGQHWLGYDVLSWLPDGFTRLFFTF